MRNTSKEDDEVIPGLPTCIAFDILSRIPSATELSRFKCVSKTWRKSLFDPYFMSLHTSRSDQNHPFYCFIPKPNRRDLPYLICRPLLEELDEELDITILIQTADHNSRPINHFTKQIKVRESPYFYLLTSHKQLLCLSTSYRIYICNPSTQDFVQLPKGSGFPFSLYNVGFGYLPSRMEYKVVRLFYTHYDRDPARHKLGYEVMTITSNSSTNSFKWRVMKEACPYAVDEQGSVTFNGFIIWLVEDAFRLSQEENENEYLLSFDLETEKLGTVPTPPCSAKVRGKIGIVELRGDLYFVDYGAWSSEMNMWILKDWNTFEWSKEYNIIFPGLETWYGREALDIVELQADGYSEQVILVHWGGNLYYYHVERKTFTLLGDGSDIRFCFYHDSFFSLPKHIA